jgi:hypothetical protein
MLGLATKDEIATSEETYWILLNPGFIVSIIKEHQSAIVVKDFPISFQNLNAAHA